MSRACTSRKSWIDYAVDAGSLLVTGLLWLVLALLVLAWVLSAPLCCRLGVYWFATLDYQPYGAPGPRFFSWDGSDLAWCMGIPFGLGIFCTGTYLLGGITSGFSSD